MNIINHRGGLVRFRDAINNKSSVKIGYIGGSITAEAAKYNWPETVNAWIKNRAGKKNVYAYNAGIGGTGSDIGVFRFDRELADKDCDLIFVEFAVNDDALDHTMRARSREGLIRKILSGTNADIVIVYTFIQSMLEDMQAGKVPKSIADFEKIAEHYNIGSVWMAKKAFDHMNDGFVSTERILRDGLHPNELGSYLYASAVTEFLDEEIKLTSKPVVRDLEPVDKYNWQDAKIVPFENMQADGGWYIRSLYNYDFRNVLYTSSLDASLTVKAKCRTMVLCRLYGTDCSVMQYRLDGGEWKTVKKDVAGWMGGSGWPFQTLVMDEDEQKEHIIEIKGIKDSRECGSSFYLAYVGIV